MVAAFWIAGAVATDVVLERGVQHRAAANQARARGTQSEQGLAWPRSDCRVPRTLHNARFPNFIKFQHANKNPDITKFEYATTFVHIGKVEFIGLFIMQGCPRTTEHTLVQSTAHGQLPAAHSSASKYHGP